MSGADKSVASSLKKKTQMIKSCARYSGVTGNFRYEQIRNQ